MTINRWFDKSFATVIFPNSRGGGFAEHGTADATVSREYVVIITKIAA